MRLPFLKPAKIDCAFVLPVALLLAATASAAGLQPYTATYEVIRDGSPVGPAQFTLRREGNGWDFRSTTRAAHGMYALLGATEFEHSTTIHSNGHLEFRRYESKVSPSSKQTIEVADPASGFIESHTNKSDHRFPMQPGVVDKMSLTLAIAEDLASGKRGVLEYPVLGREHVDVQRYEVGEQRTIDVPLGSMRAIVVTRKFDGPTQKAASYWFGIDKDFVPLRIVITESNGAVNDIRLSALNQ